MVILDYFTTTSVYSIVIIFLWIISLSSADYNLVNGETGKYRWFDTAAQIHRVCCYCPIEAVSSDKYNDAFQVGEDESRDSCNATEDEVKQTGMWPFCICEHKMGLKPEFIGCVLPNISRVEWTCDNVFTSLNVSVYTTCKPRCTKDSMVLVNPGAKAYRCGENKTWDNQPKSVYCQEKTEDEVEVWKSLVIVIVIASVGVIVFISIIIVLIITCWRRHHCCFQEIYSSSKTNSSSKMEMIEIPINSTNTESSSGDTNDNMTYETQLSDKDVNSTSDLSSISIDTINKSDCKNQKGENVTKINEEEERKSIPDSLVDAKMDSWVARLEKDIIKEEQLLLMSNNNDSKPEQPLPVKVSGLRESYRGGEVHYSVIRDKERPEPVGESTPPLQYNRQDMDSILTIEENVLEVDGPGSPSLLDKAECVQDRNSPIPSNNSNGANITSSEKCDNMPQKKIDFVEECKQCNLTLTEALNHHGSSYSLSNICHMLDPKTTSESHCWIGFVKFYGLMEGFRIKSIEYHKKGNPEDGHMQHILQELLPPLDFRVGHLTYYFSQKHSLREEVLLEIKKFHNNCKFCDICYKTAHSQSN
ncbi:uncharacterized protein LOC143085149 isoform X4 [Mytilus galloprovincialis]|uniref:uncharacterized protein LOC143085149 isoform X4 n=1 Tax=Mytilus galloprovincialis TaxID=29158 RepID=UPI003F7B60EA